MHILPHDDVHLVPGLSFKTDPLTCAGPVCELWQCFSKVQYKKGGVASGFKHVDRSVYETQLLQVKGTRNVRVSPVHLSAKSLNAGDCFVLNSANAIMQWNGSSCNKKERSKALEVSVAAAAAGGAAAASVTVDPPPSRALVLPAGSIPRSQGSLL